MNIILQDYESVLPNIWPQNKCRSLWPILHCSLILPFILKTICCMDIILWDFESVWNIWPQNKCRSLWPVFHIPVILPYILKTIWYINTIRWEYESVWPDVQPQNKCRSLWPIFMMQWFCFISWKLFSGWTWYFGTMSQYDPTSDFKIFIGHYIIGHYTFHGPVILPYILNSIWWMNIILLENESV